MDYLDVTNINIVKKVIASINTRQNEERKEDDFRAYQIDAGGQRGYVTDKLAKKFPTSHHIMSVSNVNVLKKVLDKVAKAYKTPPTRKVNGQENEELNRIYKDGKFNKMLSIMDRVYNRSKCALVWVQNPIPTEFKPATLSPYTFDLVIDNDTLEVLMVMLSYPDTSITHADVDTSADGMNQLTAESGLDSAPTSGNTYVIWTKEKYVTVCEKKYGETSQITYMIDEENPNQENKLGIIPFVFLTKEPDLPEFPTKNPLPDESININIMNSTLLTAAEKQIGVLVMKYPVGAEVAELYRGFSVALQLPQSNKNDPHIETSAEYMVPNSDLGGMKDTFLDYSASILSDNGLEGATLTGENNNYTSGLERLIASASVMDIREENKETYIDVENQIFEIIKKYDEVNGTNLFKADDELSIHFPKQQVITTEKERLEEIEFKDKIGLLEERDKFAIAFPQLSTTDIDEKITRIKEEKKNRVDSIGAKLIGKKGEDADK